MNIYEVVVAICGFALLGILVWTIFFSTRSIRQQKIKRLGERQMISSDQFYDTYYDSTGLPRELVGELLDALGKALEVPSGLLRPGDRFHTELAPLKGWGPMDDQLQLYDLMTRLELEHKIHLDRSKIDTVDQFMKAVAEAVRLRN